MTSSKKKVNKPVNRALTSNQVRSIRSRYNKGLTQTELANMFSVSRRTIGRVVSGETYSEVLAAGKSR